MTTALHIVDAATPADMLDQLSLLAGEGDAVASAGAPPRCAEFRLPVRAVHCPLGLARLAGRNFARLAERAGVVHAWSLAAGSAALAVSRRTHRRSVLSLPACPQGDEMKRLLRLTGEGDLLLTLPTAAARLAAERAGVPAGVIEILPPPAARAEAADVARRRLAVREALDIRPAQCLLVAPSQMQPGAGHKYASWVHAIIRQVLPDVLLLMPLGGPAEQRVEWFAQTTGYAAEVFLPHDCPAGLTRLDALAAADVALFLAERDTGVAAMAAAMAAGAPIVASDLPQFAECAPHDEMALLVPPGVPRAEAAAVLRLIEDRSLAARLTAAARRKAGGEFDAPACSARLQNVYAAVERPA